MNEQQKQMVEIMTRMEISKREQFALDAMNAFIISSDVVKHTEWWQSADWNCSQIAKYSFRMADAMLKESEKEVQS